MSSGPPTVQGAQYCDEMQGGGATQGMAGGTGNQTTSAPVAMPTNASAPMPVNTTTTGGPNTTTTVTSPEGRQPNANAGRKGGMGSKKLNLRHW